MVEWWWNGGGIIVQWLWNGCSIVVEPACRVKNKFLQDLKIDVESYLPTEALGACLP
jgi:hypothetical protein